MPDKYKKLLTQSYEEYKLTGNRQKLQSTENLTPAEKSEFIETCEYLNKHGYIKILNIFPVAYEYELTIDGISYVENGYEAPQQSSPIIQGDNCIYVQGSNNSISNNYNQISAEIRNSDLPEDCKQIIESFLYDIGKPHMKPDKKSERIKTFLMDIASDTLSTTAASGLTTLLMTLLSQIQH